MKADFGPHLPPSSHPPFSLENKKILVSVKFFVHNSGAGNGCANFMGAWKNALFLQENLHSHKIPLFRGGGGIFGFCGGQVPILFLWAREFYDFWYTPNLVFGLLSCLVSQSTQSTFGVYFGPSDFRGATFSQG